jgi:poly [ADP-ribose] polymerase 2/3/4
MPQGTGSVEGAMAMFEKKFREKSGLKWENRLDPPKPGKYTYIERDYEPDSEEEEDGEDAVENDDPKDNGKSKEEAVQSRLPSQVQDLVAFIFNQQNFLSAMADMSYDAQKLPLGKLSKRTLRTGFEILESLSKLILDPSLATTTYGTSFPDALELLSNRYFTTIPHIFGRNRAPIIATAAMIKKEVEVIEMLIDMKISNRISMVKQEDPMISLLDTQYEGLQMREMTPCK